MLKGLFGRNNISGRVLIVEDDAMLARVLAETLELENIKVSVVGDGLKVLDEAIKFLPDVILLDLILPGIDGFEVLKQLKEETKTTSIAVAVVSNLNQASDVKAVKALGADQYFLKTNIELQAIVKYVKSKIKVTKK